ncbi:hypothetical protein HY768_06040 [candidate division TA06 bacterium]|uniref:Nucleotidyltransferase family protein n=1 Tax=candidate division TA06 bacterium TaxID=2250710 RepID=A0A933MK94_UNCT6|nr:hypothetical protein [candidate division TA06 bacterium]
MQQIEFFTSVIRRLNEIGVQYMLTGSVASNFYGQPRLTHDVDLAVAITAGQIKVLSSKYPAPRYYLSEAAAADAVKTRTMFNLIDSETGLKADFWILDEKDVLKNLAFSRRRAATVLGQKTFIATPEDIILLKLDWHRQGGETTVQIQDALTVFEVQRNDLDMGYLRATAKSVGLAELLASLETQAE